MPMQVGIQMVEIVAAFIFAMIFLLWLVPIGWSAVFDRDKKHSGLLLLNQDDESTQVDREEKEEKRKRRQDERKEKRREDKPISFFLSFSLPPSLFECIL